MHLFFFYIYYSCTCAHACEHTQTHTHNSTHSLTQTHPYPLKHLHPILNKRNLQNTHPPTHIYLRTSINKYTHLQKEAVVESVNDKSGSDKFGRGEEKYHKLVASYPARMSDMRAPAPKMTHCEHVCYLLLNAQDSEVSIYMYVRVGVCMYICM